MGHSPRQQRHRGIEREWRRQWRLRRELGPPVLPPPQGVLAKALLAPSESGLKMEPQTPVILSYGIHYLANLMSILPLAQSYVTEIG